MPFAIGFNVLMFCVILTKLVSAKGGLDHGGQSLNMYLMLKFVNIQKENNKPKS